jgi:anti-sigma factor RsiW
MTRTTCEELADRIVDYVDGELPPDEAGTVARHLSECPRCRQTASDLRQSLGLAKVIWEDNLADATAIRDDAVGAGPRACPSSEGNRGGLPLRCPHGHTANQLRRAGFYALAVAASILLVVGVLVRPILRQSPREQPLLAEQIERQVARAGRAAQLLAATRIVAQCEGTESVVEQQYRYILREYGDTPTAESIKASHNLKLGGMPNE